MITATMTTDPNQSAMSWSMIGGEVSGPVAGVWTITCPDEVTQEVLDMHVANSVIEATAAANRAALLAKAAAAVAANNVFLAIPTPTNAQVLAQTKMLTRQATTLIKLQTEQLADISGT